MLFGLFTLAMFTEQISSILSDQTGAERLKNHQPLSLALSLALRLALTRPLFTDPRAQP